MDTEAYRKEFSGVGLRMLIGTVVILAIQIIAQVFLLLINAEWARDMNIVLAVIMIPTYALGYPIAFLIMNGAGEQRIIRKKRMKLSHFFIAFLMGYTILMAGNIIGLIVTFVLGFIRGEPISNPLDMIVGQSNIWITAIYTVLLAPIFEEMLFRKILCDRVIKYGQGAAVLLSGLLFGLFHGNFNQFFYAFFLGSFFAFIYVKTGNIRYTIGLHMMVNFIGSVVSGLFLQNIDLDLEHLTPTVLIAVAIYALFIYGIIIAGVVLLLLNRSKLKVDQGEIVLEKSRRNNVMLVNVGMILYYIFYLCMMIFQAVRL